MLEIALLHLGLVYVVVYLLVVLDGVLIVFLLFFFFQAEDGIRDWSVTGIQTCALPIVVIANVEGDFFTRAQLSLASDFVAERGGGLLVLGARSFEQRGLIGTPLEAALPVELNDRRGVVRRQDGEEAPAPQNRLVLTAEGESHPVMRIGGSVDATRKLWASFPSLAS